MQLTAPSTNLRTPPSIIATIIVVSAAASALICYLVYFHAPLDVTRAHLRSLPLLNAVLNGLCTIALLIGYRYIMNRKIPQHRAAMFTAFIFSSIFLVSYLVNFTLHGETRFNRLSAWWPFYWKLLLSHVILSVVALPMILITFFLSLTGRFPTHKKLARYTFPIWLYVSITGVIVYIMQAAINYMTLQQDTRTLLRTGLLIFGTGVVSVLLILTVFGGIGHQGPHTNSGWLALMLAMGCLPTGFLTLLLAAIKVIGDYRR